MLYEIDEYIAVKQDSSFILKGRIIHFRDDEFIIHPVYDSEKYMNYISAIVMEDKKEVKVLVESGKQHTFSDIHVVSYDT